MNPAEFIDDPNWANFLPEMTGNQKVRHLPSHDDCTRLDEECVAGHLMKGGTLGLMDGYEERQGQIDMARAIVRAFNAQEHLMIEAGTGVGKSLAYLVPAVQWAWANDTPVIVSTATRNLQSQLVNSDIPKALKTLKSSAVDPHGKSTTGFKVALLKGRGNYLCLRAVGDFFSAGYWTMSEEEQAAMPGFIEWLKHTEDGDLDGYDGLPRSLLTCPGEECGGRRCPFYSRCFLYRARRAAAEAHLVVANHALVLADSVAEGGNILPNAGRLVLDEAHNLEEIATEYLSYEFSVPALTRILNRLLRRGKGKRSQAGGIIASVQRQLQKGVLRDRTIALRVGEILNAVPHHFVRITNAAEEIVEMAEKELFKDGAKKQSSVRFRQPLAAQRLEGEFDNAVIALVNTLHDLRDTLEDSTAEDELNFFGDLIVQLDGLAASLTAFANEAAFVLAGDKPTHAFWGEKVRVEKRRVHVRLVAAPLSVADDLRKYIWDARDSVILASATLRVGNDFKYMAKRLGFSAPLPAPGDSELPQDRFRCLTAASPFDYLRQALVLAPDCLPDPSADPLKYSEALAAIMKDLFSATDGRALVLFTSYEMMNAVAGHARIDLESAGVKLLVQGEGLSRERMTEQLKAASGRTVIFGANSFWEGVDVAGEALSCVVIARLPFAQVMDPIVEARSEKIEREGGSSFRDYYLPEAVIRFRQGFGRLIRTKRDRGIVVITDPRIAIKGYGAVFRRSIPASVHTVTDLPELLSRVNDFLI